MLWYSICDFVFNIFIFRIVSVASVFYKDTSKFIISILCYVNFLIFFYKAQLQKEFEKYNFFITM